MRRHHPRENHARVADRVRRHVGVEQGGRVRARRDLVFHRHAVGLRAVCLDVAVHAPERDLIADRRRQQLADLERSAYHQFAQRDAGGLRQRGVHGVFDRAHALPLDGGELQGVLARGEARARRVLQRRRHAGHGRQQPHVRRFAVHHAAVVIGDDVADRHDFRRRVIGADVGVDQELHLVGFGALERERRDAQRQRRSQERRGERGCDRLTRRSQGPRRALIRRRAEELPPRSHDRAAARHLDPHRVRFAVLVPGVGFDAEQVVAGELRFDALEQGLPGAGDGEQRPARGARQQLEAL